MQLSQPGQVGETAILNVPDMVIAKAQPGKCEARRENVKQSENRALHGTLP